MDAPSAAPLRPGAWHSGTNSQDMKFRSQVLPFCLLVGLLAGCPDGSKKLQTVILVGTLRYNGMPISEGHVQFLPMESNAGQPDGGSILDGKYVAKRVPIGKVNAVVVIYSMAQFDRLNADPLAEKPAGKKKVEVPEKYRKGIPLIITKSTTHFDFDLRDPEPKTSGGRKVNPANSAGK